jgi:hypothetical protein
MKRSIRVWLLGLLVAGGASFGVLAAIGSTTSPGTTNRVLAQAIAVEQGQAQQSPHQAYVSAGVINAALDFSGRLDQRADQVTGTGKKKGKGPSAGCANKYSSGGTGGNNIRVNQDCSLRRQAEEVVAIDPNNPKHLIAGQNDSRVGFNHCGYDWSFDGGKTWGDQLPPFYQFINLDGVTFDACSDPTATFDSQGNAYIGGVLFEINYADSAFVVMKSNADAGGTFYHTPNSALSFQEYRDTPLGVVANDNDPNIFNDKEFIVADANASSPKADNVYATWTRFDFSGGPVGGHSPIYFSQSTDGGATWSPGIEISGAAAVCTDFSNELNPNACDQDQGSHPVVGPDGTIYVAFGNGNTPLLGVNQHLMVKCPASSNCTLAGSWTSPSKIGDDIGKQPVGPVASTACPAGRQCLPPNGYRLDDFVEGSISIDKNGILYSAWADFRNGVGSSCDWNGGASGQAAVVTPPCNNDVFYAYSTDGGATWSSTVNVTPSGTSAQWMPWSAVAPDGKKYYVAYYDRSYGSCETTGCNDITLATIEKAATGSPSIKYTRITTSSMPNLVPANNPLQAGFLGDYMWVAADSNGKSQIVWADTRGLGGTVEEDIYIAHP